MHKILCQKRTVIASAEKVYGGFASVEEFGKSFKYLAANHKPTAVLVADVVASTPSFEDIVDALSQSLQVGVQEALLLKDEQQLSDLRYSKGAGRGQDSVADLITLPRRDEVVECRQITDDLVVEMFGIQERFEPFEHATCDVASVCIAQLYSSIATGFVPPSRCLTHPLTHLLQHTHTLTHHTHPHTLVTAHPHPQTLLTGFWKGAFKCQVLSEWRRRS